MEHRRSMALVIWIFVCIVILAIICCTRAHAEYQWTDTQIVDAIYKAEGGAKARYKYGIRSVHYASTQEARKICFNTVRNNRKRYSKYEKRSSVTFISFLASRYCPIGKATLSLAERRLNGNWVKNVEYFLKKGA